ncbi:MAG: hypothetical protein GY820_39760 [Gammaproteobacteria bacterium]|nr:hypothetical protein [Gammaproteobacteria bacterium]
MGKKKIDVTLGVKNKIAAGLKTATKQLRKFGRSVSKIFKGITKGIVFAGVTIGAIGFKLLKIASDAEETGTKFEAVFSSIVGSANRTAKALAKDFGLASSSAKQMLADTADLLVGFGFAETEALKMADAVNRLAIDLASFTNFSGGAGGASKALTKLLLGETEQAKSLGIVVRQGSREYKDAVKVLIETTGATTLQAKAQVALRMATQQSGKAQGDYARTSGGLANSARLVAQRFKELAEKFGQVISDGLGMSQILQSLAARMRTFGDSPKFTAFTEKIRTALALAKDLFSVMADDPAQIGKVAGIVGKIIVLSFIEGAIKAGKIIEGALTPEWGKNLVEGARKIPTLGEIFGRGREFLTGKKYTPKPEPLSLDDRIDRSQRQLFLQLQKLAATTGAPVAAGTAIPRVTPTIGGAPTVSGAPSLSKATSLISAGQLFTMMQTGKTMETEVSLLKQSNVLLGEIRDRVGMPK